MTGEVIKSFLVGLGFDVDDSSLAKFNKSIASSTVRVVALGASIYATAAAVGVGIAGISKDFENMGYEMHLIAPQINRAILLRQEMFKAYAATGTNIIKAAQASLKLNLSLDRTKTVLTAIYRSVGAKFFGVLQKQSDLFRLKLYQNMPKIQNALEKFVKFVFKALDAVTQLGSRVWSILTRVYDFFVSLDKATDGWSTIIFGVIAAWKLLNLSFLATPLGMLLAGLAAILVLFDDFKTWQEGGESLFDWTKFVPVINAVTTALHSMAEVWRSIVDIIGDVILAFYNLFHADFQGFFMSLGDAVKDVLKYFSNLVGYITSVGGALGALGKFGMGAVSGLLNGSTPLMGSNTQNSNTNQNVQQQTNINVQGTSDASSIGKSVAGEQSRVNFDMVRNLKGAMR